MADPFHINIMSLFVKLFNDDFSGYMSDVTRASLNLNVMPSNYGLKVTFIYTYN